MSVSPKLHIFPRHFQAIRRGTRGDMARRLVSFSLPNAPTMVAGAEADDLWVVWTAQLAATPTRRLISGIYRDLQVFEIAFARAPRNIERCAPLGRRMSWCDCQRRAGGVGGWGRRGRWNLLHSAAVLFPAKFVISMNG